MFCGSYFSKVCQQKQFASKCLLLLSRFLIMSSEASKKKRDESGQSVMLPCHYVKQISDG